MPFGANPRGIYGATPPEILHQYDLGIIKHAYLCMLGVIKAESLVSGGAYTARMRVLDDRLMKFDIRHADAAMPRVRFASGASNLSKLNASEYAPLLWQMIVVLGCSTDEAIVSFGWKNKIVDCFFQLLKLRVVLCAKEHTDESIEEAQALIPR